MPIFHYVSAKIQKELLKKLHQSMEEYRTQASLTLDTYTHVTCDMQKRASEIVSGFMEHIMVIGRQAKEVGVRQRPVYPGAAGYAD